MKPIRINQGSDKFIRVAHDYTDLPSASEIEVFVGKCSSVEFTKNLSDGISEVTTDSYLLSIADTDTVDLPSGEYEIQCRITTSDGYVFHGNISPSTIRVIDTVYTDTK